MLGKFGWKPTAPDTFTGPVDIVVDSNHFHRPRVGLKPYNDIGRAGVTVFGSAHAPRIYEVNATDFPMPRPMSMPKRQEVSFHRPCLPSHLEAEIIGAILGPVKRIEGGSAVEKEQSWT